MDKKTNQHRHSTINKDVENITFVDNSEDDHFQEVMVLGLNIKTIHYITIVAVDILIMPAFVATVALSAIEWDILRKIVEPQNSSIFNNAVFETEDERWLPKSCIFSKPTTTKRRSERRGRGNIRAYTCINSIPAGICVSSRFSQSRKLSAVPGKINKTHCSQILIDCGLPVTIIRADLWEQVCESSDIVEEQPEDFQGVTRDGLRILELTRLKLTFGSIVITHPVLIAEAIAHKFILKNDFLTEYKCDIINSEGSIIFGNQRVPFTLFRSTVNLICPFIITSATTIGLHEEAIIPAFLDASSEYIKGKSILLEPCNDEKSGSLISRRVLVNFIS